MTGFAFCREEKISYCILINFCYFNGNVICTACAEVAKKMSRKKARVYNTCIFICLKYTALQWKTVCFGF